MSDSRVSFEIETPLEATTRVSVLRAEEALGEPYRARVVIDVDDPDASAEALLGQDVVVRWERDWTGRRLAGIVRAVEDVESGAGEQLHSYFALEVVPALWMLSLRRDTRMFQGMSVPEILEEVLGDGLSPYGREVQLDLSADYPTREYCLQFQETDLDFVHRLMEEEGITYAFDHEGDVEVLQLRDANAAHARASGASDPIPFLPASAPIRDEEPIRRFTRTHDSTTTAVAIRDFDWTHGGLMIESTEEGEDDLGRVRESYEHGWGRSLTISDYDAGARRYGAEDGARQAPLRLEAHRMGARTGSGVGRVVSFIAGSTFELSDHPTVGMDGEYLLTRVTHQLGSLERDPGDDEGTADEYFNAFDCIPNDVPFRPLRRTPKPRIASIQTAIVTGPSGEEIHVDEHGRIKVQFHWDRQNPADETSSCWVRVQQKWAGPGWGFWWVPRIGMEVVVEFVDGDPDRPVVTGALYNGQNLLPYPLPDEKTKSTIKSNSSPGGDGYNELRFEDKASSEEIFSHAQKDYNEVVENDHDTLVHHDQENTVDNDQTQTVHNNQTEDVGSNQVMTVDLDRTVHVEGDYSETIDGTETRHVKGDVSESFAANETRNVSANLTEDIGAAETRSVGANQTETIGGNHTLEVSASQSVTVTGALTQTVTGAVSTQAGGSWDLNADAAVNITAVGGFQLTTGAAWMLDAAGGVQQVDVFHDWIGGQKQYTGANEVGIAPAKLECFGAQFALTSQKVGFTLGAMPNLGVQFKIGFNGEGKFGCEMKMMGAEAHAWGADLKN